MNGLPGVAAELRRMADEVMTARAHGASLEFGPSALRDLADRLESAAPAPPPAPVDREQLKVAMREAYFGSNSGHDWDRVADAVFRLVGQAGASTPVDREVLGREVRLEWIAWAREQPNPKPSWLLPWEALTESEREVDRRIGERIVRLFRQQTGPPAPYPAVERSLAETPLPSGENLLIEILVGEDGPEIQAVNGPITPGELVAVDDALGDDDFFAPERALGVYLARPVKSEIGWEIESAVRVADFSEGSYRSRVAAVPPGVQAPAVQPPTEGPCAAALRELYAAIVAEWVAAGALPMSRAVQLALAAAEIALAGQPEPEGTPTAGWVGLGREGILVLYHADATAALSSHRRREESPIETLRRLLAELVELRTEHDAMLDVIAQARGVGFMSSQGPAVLDRLLSELAELRARPAVAVEAVREVAAELRPPPGSDAIGDAWFSSLADRLDAALDGAGGKPQPSPKPAGLTGAQVEAVEQAVIADMEE